MTLTHRQPPDASDENNTPPKREALSTHGDGLTPPELLDPSTADSFSERLPANDEGFRTHHGTHSSSSWRKTAYTRPHACNIGSPNSELRTSGESPDPYRCFRHLNTYEPELSQRFLTLLTPLRCQMTPAGHPSLVYRNSSRTQTGPSA